MRWTEAQKKAIDIHDKNIILSAAAGSGKTAVLVERIIDIIRKGEASVDEMLIVTFTNAAAAEMRERIYKTLTDSGMTEQLILMDKASISTFDSFAADIIREYYHIIGLKPGLKICDENKAAMLKEEALDNLFEEKFEAKDKEFLNFLDCYTQNSKFSGIRQMILNLYTYLQTLPDPGIIRKEQPSVYSGFAKECALENLNRAKEYFIKARSILNDNGLGRLSLKIAEDISAVDSLLDNLSGLCDAVVYARMQTTKAEKPVFDGIKEEIKVLRDYGKACVSKAAELYPAFSDCIIRSETEASHPYITALFNLTECFEKLYAKLKAKDNLMDFSDMSRFAMHILENENVREEYKNRFKYIFIDEFQDNNPIQEALIKKIARSNNLFMVGDVKQSIYKFRLAEPEIFMSCYKKYKSGADSDSIAIDLNNNFRSKSGVIDCVNDIFEKIMTKNSCGIEYDDSAKLVKGSSYSGPLSYPAQLYITDSSGASELKDGLDDSQLEALKAVEIIKKYHGSIIHDDKLNVDRPLEYRDMLVLMRTAKKSGEIFYKTFLDAGIPAYMQRDDGYFDSPEVQVFLNLLRIIDNPLQDIPLLSVLSCPVFGFTPDDLAEIRLRQTDKDRRISSFCNAFYSFASDCTDDLKDSAACLCDLKKKIGTFTKLTAFLKMKKDIVSLSDFVSLACESTAYGDYILAQNGGEQKYANLMAMIKKAQSFEEGSISGLPGFISYIDIISQKNSPVRTGQARTVSGSDNCIRIMTVHKSKGLEYPFVLVCGLGKKLNNPKLSAMRILEYDKDMGCAIRIADPSGLAYSNTNILRLLYEKRHKGELAESVRLLYVALTRAKDILVLSACTALKDGRVKTGILPDDIAAAGSYLELVYPSVQCGNVHIKDRRSVILGCAAGEIHKTRFEEKLSKGFNVIDENTRQLIEYEYFKPASLSKRKYSVSELAAITVNKDKEKLLKAADFNDDIPEFIQRSDHKLTGAERGNAYHRVMEHLPFDCPKTSEYIDCFIEKLASDNILTQSQADAVNSDKIIRFFLSDIGKRAAAAKKLYKESPFVMKHIYNGNEVYVQGAIDCFFEEDDGLVLLDYKSNYVDLNNKEEFYEGMKEEYIPQLALYKEALEKMSGKKIKEAVLYLFATGESIMI